MHNTLYQLNFSHYQQEHILSQLSHIIAEKDSILLLGESILSIHHPILKQLAQHHHIYILKDDKEFWLGDYPDFIQWIDYSKWVDIILQHSRCICF